MIGDAKNLPTILASSNFSGFAVIGRFLLNKSNDQRRSNRRLDADPYIPNGWGAQWFINQDNLYESFLNFRVSS